MYQIKNGIAANRLHIDGFTLPCRADSQAMYPSVLYPWFTSCLLLCSFLVEHDTLQICIRWLYPLEESTNKLLNQIMSLFYIYMFNGKVSALFHLVNTIKIKLKWKSI